MRKKILVLLLALAFAAASLLMPAAASANILFPVCHGGEVLFIDANAAQAHLSHGDTPVTATIPCP